MAGSEACVVQNVYIQDWTVSKSLPTEPNQERAAGMQAISGPYWQQDMLQSSVSMSGLNGQVVH